MAAGKDGGSEKAAPNSWSRLLRLGPKPSIPSSRQYYDFFSANGELQVCGKTFSQWFTNQESRIAAAR
jgi:hypothetical protein